MPVTLFPRNPVQYYCLKIQALALLVCGHPAKALLRFEKMLYGWPTDRYALGSYAHLLVQLKRFDESIAIQRQLVSLSGLRDVAWFNLGYLLQQTGRLCEARTAFEKAIELNACMDRAWYGLALVLIDLHEFHEARLALEKNTALQPMSPYGWYRLVQVNEALGEPEKSRSVIEHLRQFEPRVAAQLERGMRMGAPFTCNMDTRHKPVAWTGTTEEHDAAR